MRLPLHCDGLPALEEARRRLGGLECEPRIGASVRAHYDNLVRLANSLKRLGLDDSLIEASVLDVFHEYERELMRYIAVQYNEPPQGQRQ